MVSEQVAVIGLHESTKAQSCASNMTNSQGQANVMPNITGSRYIRPRNIKGFALEVHVSLANLSTNAETYEKVLYFEAPRLLGRAFH